MNEAAKTATSEIVHGGMTLAQVAELSAIARLASPPFHEVLLARGLSNEAWSDARTAWNKAIEEELERGGDGLVVAFAEALAEAKERVRRDPPTLGDRPPGEGPSSERGVAQASFQRAGVAPTHDAPIFGRPSYEKAHAVARLDPGAPASTRNAPRLDPGLSVPSHNVAALDRSAPVEPPRVAYLDEELPELGATAKVPIQSVPQRILPFQSPPPGQPTSSDSAPPSPAPDPSRARSASLGSTAPLSVPRVLPKPLPFKGNEPPASPPPAAKPGPSAQSNTPSPHPAAAQLAPRLTTEQYASLTAELSERPERAGEIRARYFVAQEAAWTALQAEWQQRMMADPRLRQRITELVAHYRGWHKRAGG